MSDHSLSILFITETWLSSDDTPFFSALNTPPYVFTHHPRDSNNYGGGIGILYKSTLISSNITKHTFTSFRSIKLFH